SQPDVTAVGGTTLTGGPPWTETVWNAQQAASGGGISVDWAMPAYQTNAAASLGVIGPASSCPMDQGNCREVPDVSADAGTPVAFYCSLQGCGFRSGGGWSGFDGTRVAAPPRAAR